MRYILPIQRLTAASGFSALVYGRERFRIGIGVACKAKRDRGEPSYE
jgi:hypothetical protein